MPAFKRPESVLIVIQAPGPRFLLLKRIYGYFGAIYSLLCIFPFDHDA